MPRYVYVLSIFSIICLSESHAALCTDQVYQGTTWNDYCRTTNSNRECKEINSQNICVCKQGFQETHRKWDWRGSPPPCTAQSCTGQRNDGLSWGEYCNQYGWHCGKEDQHLPPKCVCLDSMEDDYSDKVCRELPPEPTPPPLQIYRRTVTVTKTCDVIKENEVTWTTFCELSNQSCETDENGHKPYCGDCLHGFTNNTDGHCVVSCPNVEPPVKGRREEKCEGAEPGERCIIKCPDGFVVRGHENLTCKEDGLWDYLSPTCVANDSDPCHEEHSHSKSWGAFCHEVGATCMDSGSRTLCKCQNNQFFDGHQCQDMSPCAKKHSSGKSWSSFCRSIGGVCEASTRYPKCACHGQQEMDSGVCRELTGCVNAKEDGTEWNVFCREAGGYCVAIGGFPACTCPHGQVLKDGACAGITTSDISR